MNSECVDPIYLDPPFNSDQDYAAPVGSAAAGVLFGQQEGLCAGCKGDFPFRNFTIDHIITQSRGGTHHLQNLQLLCGACNSLKGDRPMEYLVARLAEIGV